MVESWVAALQRAADVLSDVQDGIDAEPSTLDRRDATALLGPLAELHEGVKTMVLELMHGLDEPSHTGTKRPHEMGCYVWLEAMQRAADLGNRRGGRIRRDRTYRVERDELAKVITGPWGA